MSFSIAITGKGGTGKTTAAGLIVASLLRRGLVPVLAVDADPNACLDEVLGVKAVHTVGSVREEARDKSTRNELAGIAKKEWLELKIAESLVEADGFDLIAMGRPEGPGCYCYANNVLRDVLQAIADNYPYIVIDNEAGLENLSRRIVQRVDLLVMVGDSSKRGLDTVERLFELAAEMKIEYGALAVVVNRLRNGVDPARLEALKTATGADYLVTLPENDMLAEWAEEGKSLLSLPPANEAAMHIDMFVNDAVR